MPFIQEIWTLTFFFVIEPFSLFLLRFFFFLCLSSNRGLIWIKVLCLMFISKFLLKHEFISPLFWWVLCVFIYFLFIFFNLEWKAWHWMNSGCWKIHLQHKERSYFGWSLVERDAEERSLWWFLIFIKPSLFDLILSCFCMCFLFWEERDIKVEQNYIFSHFFKQRYVTKL